jgi:hypothetical protein
MVLLASITGTLLQKEIATGWVRRVRASVAIGDLRVRAIRSRGVRARATWEFEGFSAAQIRAWTAKAGVAFERQGQILLIHSQVPVELANSLTGRHPRLRLEVEMPRQMMLEASTSFGDTEVTGEVGDLLAESNIGDVRLQQLRCSGEQITAKTAVGDARITLASLPRRRMKTEVGVGDADVGLPARAEANVAATTNAGRLTTELALTSAARSSMMVGEKLSGMLNGGGPIVEVEVSTGNARLGLAALGRR